LRSPTSVPRSHAVLPDVYSLRELARVADRPVREMAALVASGRIRTVDGHFVAHAEALRALRSLRANDLPEGPSRPLFAAAFPSRREGRVPLAASTAVHGAIVATVMMLPLFTTSHATEVFEPEKVPPVRMIFLATPGPGGGGGGGGLRQPKPPAKVLRKGTNRMSSPVPPPKPPPEPKPVEDPKPPPPPDPAPPVVAPVASVPADKEDRTGVAEESKAPDSQGPGAGGGAGTGKGTGMGEGQGPGIGEGTGGGTGGGPYRPGSGIQPPTLQREVKPEYSEEARRRSVEGDVVLEIVVRRDGSVGDVRILRGLGHGLDERAVQAVKQWRFGPARRFGTPVDVLVEVAVEFKLR
jgi:protein TonB